MKTHAKHLLALLLGVMMLVSAAGCYPLRIAKAPDPTEVPTSTEAPKDAFNTEEPATEASTGIPTEAPTEAPTEGPTEAPTEAPSEAPATDTPEPGETAAPATPTPAPTPTPKPTNTPAPTAAPTAAPTQAPTPDFVFETTDFFHDNKRYTESVFYGQKLTMINFWSTDCGPCMEELPFFGQLASKYSGRVKILTVLTDSSTPGSIEKATAFLSGVGFTLPALRYNNSMKNAFGAAYLTPPTLPTTVFVDQQGHFVACKKGGQSYSQWCALIDSLL